MAEEARAHGVEAIALRADVSVDADCREMVAAAFRRLAAPISQKAGPVQFSAWRLLSLTAARGGAGGGERGRTLRGTRASGACGDCTGWGQGDQARGKRQQGVALGFARSLPGVPGAWLYRVRRSVNHQVNHACRCTGPRQPPANCCFVAKLAAAGPSTGGMPLAVRAEQRATGVRATTDSETTQIYGQGAIANAINKV